MIIWRGLGILAPIIPVALWIFLPQLVKTLFGQEAYSGSYSWLSPVSILLGAVAVWFWGRHLNTKNTRTLIDEQTGQQIVLKPNHSLFFINMEYWAIPFALLAIFTLLSPLFK